MNDENLIPMTERTESEQRELRKKGGVNSGKSRRAKKGLKEAANMLMNMNVSPNQAKTRAMLKSVGVKDKDMQYSMAVVASMLAKASKGDVAAARFLLEATKGYEVEQKEREKDNIIEGEITLADMIEDAYKQRRMEQDEDAEQ